MTEDICAAWSAIIHHRLRVEPLGFSYWRVTDPLRDETVENESLLAAITELMRQKGRGA